MKANTAPTSHLQAPGSPRQTPALSLFSAPPHPSSIRANELSASSTQIPACLSFHQCQFTILTKLYKDLMYVK